MGAVTVNRKDIVLYPDRKRVLIRPFNPTNKQRIAHIIARVLTLPESVVDEMLQKVLSHFEDRHRQISDFFLMRFSQVKKYMVLDEKVSENRKLLLGSYFTQEYALESAALFNPSVVPHVNQAGVPQGCLRFIMSLRATGEGHISSITFRQGLIDVHGEIIIMPPTRFVQEPRRIPTASFDRCMFIRKLRELSLDDTFSQYVLARVDDYFTLEELKETVRRSLQQLGIQNPANRFEARGILHLAQSNYEVQFPQGQYLSERVIFPASPSQSNGIEDARFVRFRKDDGSVIYYATYTAFDGKIILPQLIETTDFLRFKFITLNGPAVQNKGMCLFPRKIHGHYAMLSRQDNENIFIMYSDNIHFWYSPKIIVKPAFPWEYVQLGNCGSPIELDEGWLVLSHGVGPMRRYCIGAFMLDKDNPSQVIGRLAEPLIEPNEVERDGYVPNVVYSCGALVHRKNLFIPYAMSDYTTGFATLNIDDLLNAMQ